jgi:UDP-N-acetylmuramyl pentapeptide phosphotransferase/UDP-N-acetylglucosamine-1-phosphate transferase
VSRRALVAGAVGAGLARAAWTAMRTAPPGGAARWTRTNHAGEPITLLEGPAYALAAAGAVALAPGLAPRVRAGAALATAGAAAFGMLDDLGETGTSKGLKGHLGELARGRLTTGGAKVLGIGVTGLAAAALALPRDDDRAGRATRLVDVATSGALVAGSANLLNLLDLRPGRALKATLLWAAPLAATSGPGGALAAAAAGPAVALLPEDLGERAMLGDTGANAAGALLGTALVAGTGRRTRLAVLAGVVALTLASERWSFTKVIAATPGLRELDALGRRPR